MRLNIRPIDRACRELFKTPLIAFIGRLGGKIWPLSFFELLAVVAQKEQLVDAASCRSIKMPISKSKRKKTKAERLELASKGLQVHVIGLSIHHAQVEVREKLAIPESEWNEQSALITSTGQVEEAAILSTCNRFEIYFAASDPHEANARVMEFLQERSGLPVSVLRRNIFMLEGDDAVWHLMRVAGGLDSL
eukprot:scaffold6705_cov90-Skeletonema_dohrnii-CCMP3373.AAC.1